MIARSVRIFELDSDAVCLCIETDTTTKQGILNNQLHLKQYRAETPDPL
jgi:hypothetical protein